MINDNIKIGSNVKVLRSGSVSYDEGWSGCVYVVVDRSEADAAVGFSFDDCTDGATKEDYAERLTGWYAFSSGPGRRFSDGPWPKSFGRKLLISCRFGLDV